MTAVMNFDLPRNGHFQRELTCTAPDGSIVNLTDAVIAGAARAVAGQGGVLASATFELTYPLEGKVLMTWAGADFDAFGSQTEIARPSYDVKITLDGIASVFRGQINLIPEVTS